MDTSAAVADRFAKGPTQPLQAHDLLGHLEKLGLRLTGNGAALAGRLYSQYEQFPYLTQ